MNLAMRHHDTPMSVAEAHALTAPDAGEGAEQQGLSPLLVGMQMVQPLWRTVWQFLTKLNTVLPYNQTITLLGIYTKELKMYVHINTGMWIFTAALFVIITTWKQPRCPSVGEWIHKLWFI